MGSILYVTLGFACRLYYMYIYSEYRYPEVVLIPMKFDIITIFEFVFGLQDTE